MKWIFLSLLAINVVLISIQWVNSRSVSVPVEYIEEKYSKPLKLLGEVGGKEISERQMADMCLLLGPLESQEQAGVMLQSLGSDGESSKLVVQKVKKAPSYWVYFDAYAEKTVDEWLEDFKSKKIDSYIVRSGELKGALSLGVFENIDLAYSLKKMMKKKGYESKISEINKSDSEYWLLFSAGYAAENKKKIDEMLTPFKKMHEKREIMCKSVASGK
jgi:hypothetical protein